MTQQTIRVQTDESALIANLGQVFSDRKKVLSEMMQNARRAQATEVRFSMGEDNALTVEDNGIGIENLQNLLFIARSGWDEETVKAENAFGMGWLSALFSADSVTVESRGKKVSFKTADAIAMREIPVEPSNYIGATKIVLTGFKMTVPETEQALNFFAMGFPISVYFNDEELERPYALENIVSEQTSIGAVRIRGIHMPGSATSEIPRLFFQGLPLKERTGRGHRDPTYENIVHLDASFKVRMPDRDDLIDSDKATSRIMREVRAMWRTHLTALKAKLPAEEFIKQYENMKLMEMTDLVNDVPLLPDEAIATLSGYPSLSGYTCPVCTNKITYLTQEQIERGEVVVCGYVQNCIDDDDLDGNNFAALMLAKKLGWRMLKADHGLDQGHWIFQHAYDFEEQGVTLEYTPIKSFNYQLSTTSGEVILVDSYKVVSDKHSVTFTDDAVAIAGEDTSLDEYKLIVPAGSDGSEALGQTTEWLGEWDQYHEEWEEEDKQTIRNQVAINCGEKPKTTIKKALDQSYTAQLDNCIGHSVVITVAERCEVRSASLEDVLVRFADMLAQLPEKTPEATAEAAKQVAAELAKPKEDQVK